MQQEDVYRGKVGALPAASPTSVLEENPSDFMADWPGETLPPLSVSQPATSPTRTGSSLRSPSSSDAAIQQQLNNSRATGAGVTRTRSLVETLQNCLTSLPQSTMPDSAGRSMADPSGATTSPSQQCSSRPLGKRRTRTSRRTPTTTLETDASEFRNMVQKLTGISAPAPGAVLVRPRPQRANPSSSSFIRPETLRSIRCLPPMAPTRAPLSSLPFQQHLQHSRISDVITPTVKPALSDPFVRSCKREFDSLTEEQDSPSLGSPESLLKRVMSASTTSMQLWWEQEESESRNITMTDGNPLAMPSSTPSYNDNLCAKECLLTSGTSSEFSIDSADGRLAHEPEQEFNFSQIESWLLPESMRG